MNYGYWEDFNAFGMPIINGNCLGGRQQTLTGFGFQRLYCNKPGLYRDWSIFCVFTERFPDVASLAAAEEDEVLKYWQGLGYYSRARNLHAAAKSIMERFNGVFPENYKEVLSLKGIGEYTAAAIVSFVWNQPCPIVDGNVYRVLSRLFAVDTPIDTTKGKKQFAELAGMILDPKNAGTHNQAIMELGALQCVPQTRTAGCAR